jgi:hypothetical protein
VEHEYMLERNDESVWVPGCTCGWHGEPEAEEAIALFRWMRHPQRDQSVS